MLVKEAILGREGMTSATAGAALRDRPSERAFERSFDRPFDRTVNRPAEQAIDTEFVAALNGELSMAYRLAGYVLADATEAQDAVQEASVRAWKAWPRLRERDRFRAWFSQILVNVCRTRLRQRARHRALDIDEVDVEGGDPFRAALARDTVGRALSALSLELRMVIVLRYWGDLSLADIADRLDIPIGTVKSRHHAALQTLRRRIGPVEGGNS
jgi:RNA polymerase sigma-70 factor (ECF subfamily)